MEKIEKLVGELVSLTVTELIEFKKILKDKYGLEESVAVVTAVVVEPEKVDEKTEFDVILNKVADGSDKLNTVKVINKALNVGLKPAMNLIKNLPVTLLKKVSKSEAESLKNELVLLNAEVEIV